MKNNKREILLTALVCLLPLFAGAALALAVRFSPFLGGVFAVVCAIILLNGFRQIKGEPLSERQLYIIGVPIAVAVGLLNIPADLLNTVPEMAQYLLNSPIAVSAIVCIVLNKVLPERTAAEKRSEKGQEAETPAQA